MKLNDFYQTLEMVAPKRLSNEYCEKYGAYDNSGVLLETGDEIVGVVFSLDFSQKAIDKAIETGAPIVGLSALMTTTLPSMEETIKLLREKTPKVKIMVGGAVLTEEYALKIGADAYGKDALCSVRYAESVYQDLCKNT